MPNFIRNYDGSITFKKRGMPPMEVPGFEVDEGDPYHFIPILPECEHRGTTKIKIPCCPQMIEVSHCKRYNFMQMPPAQCINCAKEGRHLSKE